MSTSHRICETCVYCSFAGNCDRHDKPLTSIEQPACDAYEIHPLLAENAKLRELVRDMLTCINNVSAHDTYCWDYCDFCKMYITKGRCDFESRMRELGVDE